MSLWLDEAYLKQILYRMPSWKQINTHQWNGRCVHCGDSEKKKNKKRGYFYERNDGLNFQCFNCQASETFATFLKWFDVNLYKQYYLEKFKDKFKRNDPPVSTQERLDKFIEKQQAKVIDESYNSFYDGLPTVEDCGPGHEAFELLKSRKIPRKFFSELYYTDKFINWTEGFTEKYSNLTEHPRIIIPFWDHLGRTPYFQGRSFGKIEPRYFTYKILEDSDYKAFGLDKINRLEVIRVVEGPFDSLFLKNCVAVASSALHKFHIPGCKHLYVFDNEPRNKDICKLIRETVKAGKSVVIWPAEVSGIKDINDMVLAGFDVEQLVTNNTYQGLAAQLKFNEWVK